MPTWSMMSLSIWCERRFDLILWDLIACYLMVKNQHLFWFCLTDKSWLLVNIFHNPWQSLTVLVSQTLSKSWPEIGVFWPCFALFWAHSTPLFSVRHAKFRQFWTFFSIRRYCISHLWVTINGCINACIYVVSQGAVSAASYIDHWSFFKRAVPNARRRLDWTNGTSVWALPF